VPGAAVLHGILCRPSGCLLRLILGPVSRWARAARGLSPVLAPVGVAQRSQGTQRCGARGAPRWCTGCSDGANRGTHGSLLGLILGPVGGASRGRPGGVGSLHSIFGPVGLAQGAKYLDGRSASA